MSKTPMEDLGRLMVVDDDVVFNRVLGRALAARGFAVESATSLDQAMALLARPATAPPDYAVVDLNLAGSSGLKLISALRAANDDCRILMLTGYASIATAVDAIKLGASQYLAKPVDTDTICKALIEDDEPDDEATPDETLSVSRLEWEHIQRVLTEHAGNISATARALKMHRRTLQRKLLKRPLKD
jgi:two-component system, response regulator RegA